MTEPQIVRDPQHRGALGFEPCQGPRELGFDVCPDGEGLPAPQEDDSLQCNQRRKSRELSDGPKGSGMESAVGLAAALEADSSPVQAAVANSRNTSQIGKVFEWQCLPAEILPRAASVMADEAGGDSSSAIHEPDQTNSQHPYDMTETSLTASTQHDIPLARDSPLGPTHLCQDGSRDTPADVGAEDASADEAVAASPTRHSTRVLQLKARFERPRQVVTDSELQQASDGSPTGSHRRDRRQSECVRPVSPPTIQAYGRACQSVRDIRSRFEQQLRNSSRPESKGRNVSMPVASRRIAAETLGQLETVDIAARYGKPYRRKEKTSDVGEQHGISVGPESPIQATRYSADKRVEIDSPAEPVLEQRELADTGIDSTNNGGGDANIRSMPTRALSNSSVPDACFDMQSAIKEQIAPDGDGGEGECPAATTAGYGKAKVETPASGLCGRPSPEIGRLAALVAAQAQNYGKPVPRRLLTRQDTDTP